MADHSDLLDGGFLRLRQVLRLVPISKSTLWAWIKAGKFPSPVKISERVTCFRSQDIQSWMERFDAGADKEVLDQEKKTAESQR